MVDPQAVNCGLASPAEGRAANLHASDADQDGAAPRPRRANGKNARLGGRRVRRLYAEMSAGILHPPKRVREPCYLLLNLSRDSKNYGGKLRLRRLVLRGR